MLRVPTPSWLLLFWCGLVASIASEWAAAFFRAVAGRGRNDGASGNPRLMREPRGSAPIAIITGTLISAPAYGLVFEWFHRADLTLGATLGAIHGTLAGALILLAAIRNRHPLSAGFSLRPTALYRVRRFATRVLYGALMGLLYAVPR
jgi:hypothetical protein